MISRDITIVACLGTGAMGHGVAFLAARAGYAVRLFGRSRESLERGREGIRRVAALYEEAGLMPSGRSDALLALVSGVTDPAEAAAGADFVIESVAEDLGVKREVLKNAEAACPDHAILATNTSSLRLTDIAAALRRPERFLACHFYNPPYLMPVVEVCPGPATLPALRDKAAAWIQSLGNEPVVMEKEVQGYIVNRIQAACLREALHIVEQGWADAATVDKAVARALGRRYCVTGPLESADMGGLEVFKALLDQLGPNLSRATAAPALIADAVAAGRLGVKSGDGLFPWPGEKAEARRAARERSLLAFLREDMRQS